MKIDWLHWTLGASLFLVSFTAWVTPYRYEHWLNGHLVRIHRLTGEAEQLVRTGWRAMDETRGNYTLEK